MKVYIAGPMNGVPDFNFPAFHAAEDLLAGMGWEVVSPARDNEVNGYAEGSDATTATDTPQAHMEYMRRDILLILGVEGVVLLSGWERSSGANVELAVARAIGLDVFTLTFDTGLTPSQAVPTDTLDVLLKARALLQFQGEPVSDAGGVLG